MMIESKSDFRYSHLRSLLVGRSVNHLVDMYVVVVLLLNEINTLQSDTKESEEK